ncbi:thioesterase family protein [Alkalihalobacillus sp. BA299]|uniref:acyl-CoA thioesterase n=1 Tax=Alkalihalobacillus sp. BA299 TaxID=2815938 RepID=UPI001ADAC22A|nr:thioesterase family protein [Alkalihalobacillus sp. BA299]
MTYTEFQLIVETKRSHLSNVELLGYLDDARYCWYEYCIAIGVEALVVHISTDFKKEVFNQEKMIIRTWIDRVGNTSFVLQQKVVGDHNEHIASSQVVLATVNKETRMKTTVPQEVRDLLMQEGTLDFKRLDKHSSYSTF